MAINLDVKLQLVENKDRKHIVVYDITGVSTNENGFQSEDGTINSNNPKASYIERVELTFIGDEIEGNKIEISDPDDVAKFFDQTEGYQISSASLFSTTYFPVGVYEIEVTYIGSGDIDAQNTEFTESDYIYKPIVESFYPAIRQLAVEINIPLNTTAEDLNKVINSAVIGFLLQDVNYACELGLKDKGQDIVDQLQTIINNDGKFVDNLIV